MKKVYISGPITDVKDAEMHFTMAEDIVKSRGFTVLNPYRVIASSMPDGLKHEEYMHVAFAMLDIADYIYMLSGWEKSFGAAQEYGYAIAKGIPVLTRDEISVNKALNN